jgi:DNA repair protein RecO (recombination protein O)
MSFLTADGYFVRWGSLGGGDRWLKFYTRQAGMIRVLVGHKKLEQFPPLSNPALLDLSRLTLIPRRRHPGARLADFHLLGRHLDLALDLHKLGRGLLFLEVLEEMSADEDPQPAVFDLLGEYLGELARSRDPETTSLHALFRLLGLLGYRPALDACRRCRKPAGRRNLFLAAEGGFVHEDCAGGRAGLSLSPGTVRFLERQAAMAGLGEARGLKGDRLVRAESGTILEGYLQFLCQNRLDALIFLDKLARHEAGGGPAQKAVTAAARAAKKSVPREKAG